MALGVDDTEPLKPSTTATATATTTIRPTAPPQSQLPASSTSPTASASTHNPSDYVTFLINGTDTVFGHRQAIISNCTELARIITETRPLNGGSYPINGINIVDFESLIKFCENKLIKIEDVDDGLRKLDTAKRFQCSNLIRRCVKDLDLKLTASTCIKVFRSVRYYVVAATPSKKSIDKKTPDECLESLLYNCFQYIDMNADVVLQRDEVLDLSFSEIEMILRRDHLMTSEVVLFNLIANWSRVECQRRNLDLTSENRRRVLGSLSYIPRYLRMTLKDFDLTCQRIDILDPEEVNLIHDAFKGKHLNLTSEQSEMLANFKRARPKFARMPVHLSDRSNPKNYSKKMRNYEQTFADDGNSSWLLWLCGCYAFVCD